MFQGFAADRVRSDQLAIALQHLTRIDGLGFLFGLLMVLIMMPLQMLSGGVTPREVPSCHSDVVGVQAAVGTPVVALVGNPNVKGDWYIHPKTNEEINFIDFARSEGRFAKHFDKEGNPSALLLHAKQDRLENWHLLQELAGLR